MISLVFIAQRISRFVFKFKKEEEAIIVSTTFVEKLTKKKSYKNTSS